ncbi:MAG: response regulator [Alphaproteobacteria bacterium]|nr:response regulator [Alphaproteobacteria bacterium]
MSDKPHILFVDDEANILMGLRRGLRVKRKEWDMSFAEGGVAALEIIKEQPVDIVVSDMRMPGMDGAALLEEVRTVSPDTARIILSGYAEEESVLRVVGPAHQYLAKPCDFNILQEVIERLILLRGCFQEQKIRNIVSQKKNLASLPEVYMDLLAELENTTSTSNSIAEIIDRDLGLRTQILKVCNSAFFGLPQPVLELETAVSVLGLGTLRSMALLNGIFSAFKGSDHIKSMMERLSQNSMKIAVIARKIAEEAGYDKVVCGQVSSAGMLAHIGSLILMMEWPEKFEAAAQMAEAKKMPIDNFERELFGTDHAMIGAYFLGLWGFPLSVCEAVAYHHRPQLCQNETQPVLAVLHFSQQLTRALANQNVDLSILESGIDRQFLVQQNLTISVEKWQQIVTSSLMEGNA